MIAIILISSSVFIVVSAALINLYYLVPCKRIPPLVFFDPKLYERDQEISEAYNNERHHYVKNEIRNKCHFREELPFLVIRL